MSLKMYGDGLDKMEEISQDIIVGFLKYLADLQGKPFNLEKAMYSAISNVITSMVGDQFRLQFILKPSNRYSSEDITQLYGESHFL